jgi:hypothetical protein
MKKLIVGTFALVAGAIFAGAQSDEMLDYKFIALTEWSAELNAGAAAYNKICSNPEAEGCSQIHSVLAEQMKYFVECANRYSTSGTDCRAKLRPLIIMHIARMFRWNIDCTGRPVEGEEALQCGEEGNALAKEKTIIQKRVDQCEKDVKDEKL